MATEWTAPQLARAMHRAGWAALLMLLPITVDGRSVVGGPLAIVVAVLVWRMAAVAPHRARVALGVASGAMLATVSLAGV